MLQPPSFLTHADPFTQATTSGILWGVGDLLAQRIAEQRSRLDVRRTKLTAVFGAGFMGPVGHYWYIGLDNAAKFLLAGLARPSLYPLSVVALKVVVDSAVLG